MRIGDWQIDWFVSGLFRLDGGAMFGVVPKSLWSRTTPADEENRISMAMRLLLIRGRGRTILVDSGAGRGYDDKLNNIYAFESNTPIPESLEPFAIQPEDVTDVLVTHLHFDHGGGLATPEGRGWRLTFPNAVHHIQASQWHHALDPNPRDRASYFRPRIEIIEQAGRLELHDGAWEFGPGLELLPFQGHTPGQQLPRVHDGEATLFYCGDLVPTSAHIPIPYIMAYDLQPLVAMEEKTTTLRRAAAEGWILFFEHDPDIVACRVEERERRFARGPIVNV